MKNTRLAVAALFLFSALAARADNWTQWVPFGNSGLSIRWSQVNRDTCTWAFRNDTKRTLAIMNFNIVDTNADTGVAEHTTDVLPTLQPGQALGGWTAFSATANCSAVRLTATNIQWN